jgi:hemolysin III
VERDPRHQSDPPLRPTSYAPRSTTRRRWREPVNGLTHLAGAALSVVALAVLIGLALYGGKTRHLIAFIIFGVSLVALYTSSALYHLLPLSRRGIRRMQQLDHMMIFVLIAGTYTPFCVVALQGGWRWGLLGTVWTLALLGIALKIWWMHAPIWISTLLYLFVGWVAVAAAPTIMRTLPTGGVAWLIAGGVIYSLGAVVFAANWPTIRRGAFEAHELWHLFVIAGSGCHVWAVARYLPAIH